MIIFEYSEWPGDVTAEWCLESLKASSLMPYMRLLSEIYFGA